MVLAVEAPKVIAPLEVVIDLVPEPPNVMSPFNDTTPLPVEILPPFHVKEPPTVNDALVDEAAARSWLNVKVPLEVNVIGSLNDKFAWELIEPEYPDPPIVIEVNPSARYANSAAVRFKTLESELLAPPS